MQEHKPWKGKTGGGKFGQQFLFVFLKYVRVRVLYPVLYLVVPFYMLFGRESCNAVYHYFRRIRGFGRWRAFWATSHNFHTFGKVVLDKFAILAGRADQFKIKVPDQNAFDRMLDQEGGFIVAGSHVGNMEMMGQSLSQNSKPLYGIIYGGESEEFQHRRDLAFAVTHVTLIPIRSDMSHLFMLKEALDKGGITTIFCDRIFGSEKTLRTDFFGFPAHFPLGPFKLASQLHVPMLALFLMKERGSNYTGYVFPLKVDENEANVVKRSEQLLHQYVEVLEEMLVKYPYQWFNLYEFWEQ